jgi:hypothetical protein
MLLSIGYTGNLVRISARRQSDALWPPLTRLIERGVACRHDQLVPAKTHHVSLPSGTDGEVVMRPTPGGPTTVEGWVGSLDGHRLALDAARQMAGAGAVDDREVILLGHHARR